MTERMTPRIQRQSQTGNLARRERDAMRLQHTHKTETATIFVLDADSASPSYMACFGRRADEPWYEIERRWDIFAKQMWAVGVEPLDDEPFFTVVEDGMVWDHMVLREIEG